MYSFLITRQQNPKAQGIAWAIISCFWFAIMTILVRHLSENMSSFLIVFFRNAFALMFMLPWRIRGGKASVETRRMDLNLLRALSGSLGMYAWFYAIAVIPLHEAVSLSFTVPLVTALMGIIFLKEKIGTERWAALIIGFMGTLVILRPGADTFRYESLWVLSATITWSISNIIVKKLTQTDTPRMIVFYMTFLMTPLTLPLAILHWKIPTASEFGWLLILGWTSNLAQISISHAYAKAEIGVILPFDFFRLLFVSIFAYFLFNEAFDWQSGIGAGIILGSAFLIVHHEVKLARITKRLARKLIE